MQASSLINIAPHLKLIRGRYGWFLANPYDQYLGHALIRYGEYSELELSFLCSLLHEGETVVEIGANVGYHTVPLAQSVGSKGKVIAIEAQPVLFHQLCANLALNSIFNVTTHALGCAASRSIMTLPELNYSLQSNQNFGAVALRNNGNGRKIDVYPLDDLIQDKQKVNLIKIDVEGMEGDVLIGASSTIRHSRPIIYLENDQKNKSQQLIEQLWAMDYKLWWHTPKLYNPKNYFNVESNEYGNTVAINMLALPKESKLRLAGLLEVSDASFFPT